jgi:hypothetical protein
LSQEGQRLLDTELYGMYSMRSDVPPPAGQKPMTETYPLLPADSHDYVQASRDFPSALRRSVPLSGSRAGAASRQRGCRAPKPYSVRA